jgi:hypothetical protein
MKNIGNKEREAPHLKTAVCGTQTLLQKSLQGWRR